MTAHFIHISDCVYLERVEDGSWSICQWFEGFEPSKVSVTEDELATIASEVMTMFAARMLIGAPVPKAFKAIVEVETETEIVNLLEES